MTAADVNRLRLIKTFTQLVKYLRDDLDWPIDADNFDEVTFEYDPMTELGLDAKSAAKVQEVKQLRPFTTNQPWGIFFVKFEPKSLPVVALRRLLANLVVKKRASAQRADRAAWQLHDLLFISQYGEADGRQITFAHFADEDDNLPTLRVLGWDGDDTNVKLEHVHHELTTKLRLRGSDQEDLENWRRRWSSAFELKVGEVIRTSKDLAIALAHLAQRIRKKVNTAVSIETEKGALRRLHAAFQQALIHDLKPDDFADMYAQTISYGLLAARISRHGGRDEPSVLTADNLTDMVPITNPFLRELFQTFLHVGGRRNGKGKNGHIDFDELGISEVVDLLRNANMDAVLRDFGNRNPQEDPVIHFYELFLKQYDRKKRMQRGVFYTPRPVVSYIVRSVHELLQTEFGLADGLADTTTWGEILKKHENLKLPTIKYKVPDSPDIVDKPIDPNTPFVQILDPATGTATFLVEVIEVIYQTVKTKWVKAGYTELYDIPKLWNEYVPKHLLPRLHGYELMMAPYAIAHMKIGLKLFETGYKFGSGERARIYLTNALEPPQDFSETFEQMTPALAHEAKSVNEVKQNQRFTVIIGNPPYSALSANLTEHARRLVARFKFIDGIKLRERGALQLEKNLQDDYVKFLAFADDRLTETTTGICGMICNHGFVDNPTLRGLRWSLLSDFRSIWVLDLHGNVNRREVTPDGSEDQNVFDIKDAGVAIFLGLRSHRTKSVFEVRKADLWGERQVKYPFLLNETVANHSWETISSRPDFFLFRSVGGNDTAEYSNWMKVTDVFPLHSIGIITARDSYVIDYASSPVLERATAFRDSTLDDEETCKALGIPLKKGWNVTRARQRIRQVGELSAFIQPLLYRPFDVRPVFYHESLIWGMAWPVMQHMLGGTNLALITSRMTKGEDFQHVFVSKGLSEVILLSSKTSNNAFAFPLTAR